MNDIFLAYGDSFTWGHGLQYYDWIKNSKMSKEEIKDFLLEDQKSQHHQWVNFDFKCTAGDLESMRERRYTTLLSKELGMDYISRINNGGTNLANINMIERILSDDYNDSNNEWNKVNHSLSNDKLMNRKIKFIILQLTDIQRDFANSQELRVHAGELEHARSMIDSWWDVYVLDQNSAGIFKPFRRTKKIKNVDKFTKVHSRVAQLYKLCKKKDIKLYVWAWPSQVASFFIDEPYFVTINYEGKEYPSYDDMLVDYPKFRLGAPIGDQRYGDLQEYGVTDEHPSEHFHKLISEVLLNRINGEA
jgi:hypothetical protein